MTFDWTTFVLQLVNVVILLAILRHFLFRPVAAMIETRQAASAAALAEARQAKIEAEAARTKAEAEGAASVAARKDLLEKARTETEASRKEMLDAARKEAGKIVADGAAERARQAAGAKAEAMDMVGDLALTIAGRALAAQPLEKAEYAERLAAALRDMKQAERDALLQAPNLRIVMPEQPTPALRRKLDAALKPFGVDAPVQTDPAMMAGMELYSDNGEVLNSLRHDIQTIARAMNADRTIA